MRSQVLQMTIATLLLAATGCVSLSLPGFGPSPSGLREQADAAVEAGDLDAAYDHLAELYRRYPEHEETAEAFPLAAAIFQRLYTKNRFSAPESRWLTTEPEFLFGWLASLANGEFPETEARSLFVGLHYGFFRRFERFAKANATFPGWEIAAIEDNGIVETLRVKRQEQAQADR